MVHVARRMHYEISPLLASNHDISGLKGGGGARYLPPAFAPRSPPLPVHQHFAHESRSRTFVISWA